MSTTLEDSALVDDEIIVRGEQVYEDKLKNRLESSHKGRFVAIEPDSGNYFLGDTGSKALWAAHKAMPEKRFFLKRIGYHITHKLGGHGLNHR